MKKIILTAVITFIITTIFWFIIGLAISNSNDSNSTNVDYAEDIIGKWKPIEVAEHQIEFSKYGTMIETISAKYNWKKEYPYSISGDQVTITQQDDKGNDIVHFTVKVTSDDSNTYLEIYDVTILSGKYKKIK